MPEVTGVALARKLGVTKNSVYQARKKGRIACLPNGKYDLEQALTDWHQKTHGRWGGKRISRRERNLRMAFEPGQLELLEYWQTVAQQAYPYVALGLATEHQMPPKEVWKFIRFLAVTELLFVMRELEIPEDRPIPMPGIFKKLHHLRDQEGEKLCRWLEREAKKGPDEPLDESVWK